MRNTVALGAITLGLIWAQAPASVRDGVYSAEQARKGEALYRQESYQEVEPFNDEPYAHHWFEKRLKP